MCINDWPLRVWNSPNSLMGLIGAAGGVGNFDRETGVVEVAGGWLIGILGRRRWASAITLGDVILYADGGLIAILHAHEMVHVSQGRAWGPLFLPAYLLESLFQWLRTRDGYHDNRFERAARDTQNSKEKAVPVNKR